MVSRFLPLLILPSLAAAYSFDIATTPRQCDTLNITLTGSGQPPYSLLVVPFGASPLPNNVEVRTIVQQNFTGDSVSLQLKYPTASQFVAVVSDQTGFGSGGSTGAVTVLSNDNSSCFNPSQGVTPGFVYSLVPNSLQQCAPTRIWWDPTAGTVQGTPFFRGVIPGGQSFTVPQGSLSTVPEQGLGFSWSPSVRAGTTVILIGGDDGGPGRGGSSVYFVNFGDNSCLNSNSPSSTAGSPAGGNYPTSTSGAGTGNGSGSHSSNTGAIVGGVIGGIVALVALLLLLLFFIRRRRFHRQQQERPVDLLHDQEEDGQDGHPPQYYQPEPFVVPEPTVGSSSGAGENETAIVPGAGRPSLDHRNSRYSNLTGERSLTPDPSGPPSTYMRKSPAPSSFRPVNIVQHDDAGPSEPETVELPPAYTNIHHRPAQKTADEEDDAPAAANAPAPPAATTGEPETST